MTNEPQYTINQYEQVRTEAIEAENAYKRGHMTAKTRDAFQHRQFKVWLYAWNDVTPEQASSLPKLGDQS